MSHDNPILDALHALSQGQSLDQLLFLRERQLPSPQAWLDAGWDALAELPNDSVQAKWLVQLMHNAWGAAGPVGRQSRPAWTQADGKCAQSTWQQVFKEIQQVSS